jgi:hypothetical protein
MSVAIESERLDSHRYLLPRRPPDPGTAPEDMRSQPRRWGHLDILERIGEGAYGEVFLAWDPKLSRQVALKLLRDTSDTVLGSAVIREASMMARVAHPNVVTIYGADLIDGQIGIWMEFIRGRTLKQILTTSGPFGPRETSLIGVELCRAVAAPSRCAWRAVAWASNQPKRRRALGVPRRGTSLRPSFASALRSTARHGPRHTSPSSGRGEAAKEQDCQVNVPPGQLSRVGHVLCSETFAEPKPNSWEGEFGGRRKGCPVRVQRTGIGDAQLLCHILWRPWRHCGVDHRRSGCIMPGQNKNRF